MIYGHLADVEHPLGSKEPLEPVEGKFVLTVRPLIEVLLAGQKVLLNALRYRQARYRVSPDLGEQGRRRASACFRSAYPVLCRGTMFCGVRP